MSAVFWRFMLFVLAVLMAGSVVGQKSPSTYSMDITAGANYMATKDEAASSLNSSGWGAGLSIGPSLRYGKFLSGIRVGWQSGRLSNGSITALEHSFRQTKVNYSASWYLFGNPEKTQLALGLYVEWAKRSIDYSQKINAATVRFPDWVAGVHLLFEPKLDMDGKYFGKLDADFALIGQHYRSGLYLGRNIHSHMQVGLSYTWEYVRKTSWQPAYAAIHLPALYFSISR